jgi:hypothetical protein
MEQWLALCPNLAVLDMLDMKAATVEEMEVVMRAMVNEAGLPVLRRLQHCGFPPLFPYSRGVVRRRWSHDMVSARVRVLTAYSSCRRSICDVRWMRRRMAMSCWLRCCSVVS